MDSKRIEKAAKILKNWIDGEERRKDVIRKLEKMGLYPDLSSGQDSVAVIDWQEEEGQTHEIRIQ